MDFFQNSIRSGNDLSQTILMNETAVYLEDPCHVTINEIGKRHGSLKNNGFASMRIIVLLSIRATRQKLPPVIIFKKLFENGTRFQRCEGCYVFFNEKAWVNQLLVKEWIDIVFPQLDMKRDHLDKTVKEHLKRRGIRNDAIPGTLTPYVQAGDLGIYKSFKDKISPITASWKSSDAEERTASGNPKPPNQETVCRWVKQVWSSVGESVILNSIKAAGFGDDKEWMIYKHDLYGEGFLHLWLNRGLHDSINIEDPDNVECENRLVNDQE
ncbi:hypothetical protein PsorP6_010455 [Peronosclerospora sorghi]|uniref:Uncharacterized protein n=1 Tax=Peronosclerospora sorghi TaxID=230839 RepID=A0ACC0VW47_9STRA|nr:hypothetical protein PsorP6_010455 [Peronosclerospora sorghi]